MPIILEIYDLAEPVNPFWLLFAVSLRQAATKVPQYFDELDLISAWMQAESLTWSSIKLLQILLSHWLPIWISTQKHTARIIISGETQHRHKHRTDNLYEMSPAKSD